VYLGIQHRFEKQYHDRYHPGFGALSACIGTVRVTRHTYTCDHCAQAFVFPEPATEPFYCHSAACQGTQEVSIDPV
jgi:hypothetical protein